MKKFKAYIKRYIYPLPRFRNEVVVMIDGTHIHGGLTDRFKVAMSVFSYCKEKEVPFRLYYIYPCELTNIIIPNRYDWRIGKKDVVYNRLGVKELYLYNPGKVGVRYLDYSAEILETEMSKVLKKKRQIHIYGNCFYPSYRIDYKKIWDELFKPSDYLSNRLASLKNHFSNDYSAGVFRFQQLLGDFEEGDYPVLSVIQKNHLIEKCLEKITQLYNCGYFSTEKVLVTSDSPTFLQEANKLPFVQIIEGRMEHMDYTHNNNLEVCAKSFVDLFLLSEATKITLFRTGAMYHSGFPKFAAEIGGKKYNEIIF